MAKPKISIIGPGVVGQAIGRLLKARRYPVAGVAGTSARKTHQAVAFIGGGRAARSPAAAARGADVVFITTPDRMIRPVCEEIVEGGGLKRGAAVIHCSGAFGLELLEAAHSRKALTVALHPLQSFASPKAALKRMKGTCFTFDGDEAAAETVESIVSALGGRMLSISPQNRAVYHAATCVLSNYLVAIADLGTILLKQSGLPEKEAVRAVRPLIEGTVENIGAVGLPHALTGPIARGDTETVERHLQALAGFPYEIRRLYCELGLYTVRVAQRKGTLQAADARHLVGILNNGLHR